jgi:hypothetical protein
LQDDIIYEFIIANHHTQKIYLNLKKQDNMDKIYLRLRKNVMILLDDGLWTLVVGDMIVLQKIGQKLKKSNIQKY